MIKKVLIIVLALAVLGGAYYYFFVAKSTSTSSTKSGVTETVTDQGVTLANASGSLNVVYLDAQKTDFGVAIYPKAALANGTKSAAKISIKGTTYLVGLFTSTDSLANVVSYYQKQMGSQLKTSTLISGTNTITLISSDNVKNPTVQVYRENNLTNIRITKPV